MGVHDSDRSTPGCQEGVLSQGKQWREEHRVVNYVQVEHYQGHLRVWESNS